MSFISYPFVVFFCSFFFLYWLIFNKQYRLQNLLLLIGSYFFYAWFDWRLLFILMGISAFNFFIGLYIEKVGSNKLKKRLLFIGIFQGIGGLFLYKYFNFFIGSFNNFFISLNIHWKFKTLNWTVPLGISFFTFKTISYLIDISKQKTKACKKWVDFFVYVSFFPTILSGPIDKASAFIPQLEKPRVFEYKRAAESMRQILWGLFKKVVIADNCAAFTNRIFDGGGYLHLPAAILLIGAILYSFQIYTDFSGYSDIAIGIASLLGFKITKNFNYPFFSQNIAEFWRKWHISLTAWLTEYVFTPLSISFRDYGKLGLVLAIILNFCLVGIWHGANWTYLVFGFLHGCYYIPLVINGTMNKKKKTIYNSKLDYLKKIFYVLLNFFLVTFTFIIFRSNSINEALQYFNALFSLSLFVKQSFNFYTFIIPIFFIAVMLLFEWFGRYKDFAIAQNAIKSHKLIRWSLYVALIICIIIFGADKQQFVYAKF